MATNGRKTAGSGSAAKGRSTPAKNTKSSSRSWWQNKAWWRSHSLAVAFVAVFAAIGGYLLYSSFAATSTVTLYKLASQPTLCMDNTGQSHANGTPMILYNCNAANPGDPAQHWTEVSAGGGFMLQNIASNGAKMCVDDLGRAVGTGPSNRVRAAVWGCNPSDPAQIWTSFYGGIKNTSNAGCINQLGGNTNQLIIYECVAPGTRGPLAKYVVTSNEIWTRETITIGSASGGTANCKPDLITSYGHDNPGAAQNMAKCLMPYYGFSVSSQFGCLQSLWNRESGWRAHAQNPTSTAYGIPQDINPSGMGYDWQNDNTTQIKWGLSYIKTNTLKFHPATPCGAWAYEEANGNY